MLFYSIPVTEDHFCNKWFTFIAIVHFSDYAYKPLLEVTFSMQVIYNGVLVLYLSKGSQYYPNVYLYQGKQMLNHYMC